MQTLEAAVMAASFILRVDGGNGVSDVKYRLFKDFSARIP
jgi:hypothetical protein